MTDPLRKGRYRHFKGNEYQVVDVARDSETQQWMVVYRALYGEGGLWVRPLSMFTEIIERDGRRVARFEFIGDQACKFLSTAKGESGVSQ